MKRRRVSLSVKLNILIVVIILAISLGLMATCYRVYCEKVDTINYTRTVRAARTAVDDLVGDMVAYFWKQINTDEFREARRRAVEAKDEGIVRDWMESRRSFFDSFTFEGEAVESEDASSLYDDYCLMIASMNEVIDIFSVKDSAIQFEDDGTTYNLVDPREDLMFIGSIEEDIDVFEGYGDNAVIPPTVYHSRHGWLCTACEPIPLAYTGTGVAGIVAVDIDMNSVVQERRAFILNCVLFVLIQLVIAIAVSMVLMRRAIIRPLNSLAQAATRFVRDDEGYTKADVIDLPIRSNDEIGDLYREIQSMETRIVDYTVHLAQVTAERERVHTELSIATKIQANMLPNTFPAFPDRTDFDLFASMTPAKEVGGDFYDFVLVDDDHLAVLIADVSDKGVPAALFMMSSKIIINYCIRMGGTPGEVLTAANAQLCRNNKSRMFVTVWLGLLELSTGKLTCTNAGHEYPIIRGGDGEFRVYKDKHGFVCGGIDRMKYSDYELQLQPGDALFVYTDGVPEANDAAGDFYTMERLVDTLNRLPAGSPKEIIEGVKADVDAFVNGADQFDDLTMLCLTYKGRT